MLHASLVQHEASPRPAARGQPQEVSRYVAGSRGPTSGSSIGTAKSPVRLAACCTAAVCELAEAPAAPIKGEAGWALSS